MSGLSRPSGGTLRLFGHDLVRQPQAAGRYIALQPQATGLPSDATARELLELTGRLRGQSTTAARQQTEALLEGFGLLPHAGKLVRELSGGLKRLVYIAVTLAADRPVLIFDEPTNDLDPEIRRTVWQRIRQAALNGSTVILVTHNVAEAEQAPDRVAIIRCGRILALGTPGELKSQVSSHVRLELAFRPEGEGERKCCLRGTMCTAWVSTVMPCPSPGRRPNRPSPDSCRT